jgi:hypothetical protein
MRPDDARATAAADHRALRRVAIAVAVGIALAVSAVAFGTTHERDVGAGSPAGTVRAFLIDTGVDHYGVDGCRYLTVQARRRLQRAPSHPSCAIALSQRQLRLGGRVIDDEGAVKALDYRSEQDRTRALVTVSGNGASLSFGLRRATAGERAEFRPPPTGWRIDSGISGLAGW